MEIRQRSQSPIFSFFFFVFLQLFITYFKQQSYTFCHALLVICKCTMQNKMCWCIYHFISAAVCAWQLFMLRADSLQHAVPPRARLLLRASCATSWKHFDEMLEDLRKKMNVSRLWWFSTWLWLNKNGVHLTAVNGVLLHTTTTCDWGKHCMHRQFSLSDESDYIPPVLDIIFQIWVCLSCSYFVNVTDVIKVEHTETADCVKSRITEKPASYHLASRNCRLQKTTSDWPLIWKYQKRWWSKILMSSLYDFVWF